jgi:hypothetical protein
LGKAKRGGYEERKRELHPIFHGFFLPVASRARSGRLRVGVDDRELHRQYLRKWNTDGNKQAFVRGFRPNSTQRSNEATIEQNRGCYHILVTDSAD